MEWLARGKKAPWFVSQLEVCEAASQLIILCNLPSCAMMCFLSCCPLSFNGINICIHLVLSVTTTAAGCVWLKKDNENGPVSSVTKKCDMT